MEDTTYKLAMSADDVNWPKMIRTTPIPGLLIYERDSFPDDRGFFRGFGESTG